MTSNEDYKSKVVTLIDDYLQGKTSRDVVWKWAQDVIISDEYEQLPQDVQDAIHGVWLLHDDDEQPWVPDNEELLRIRNDLAK